MMSGAGVVSRALADGVGVNFVDLFVPSASAEQFARLFSRATQPL